MANTRPVYPQLPLAPPTVPQPPDSSGLNPDTIALLNSLYPQPQQPQLQTSPGFHIGPLRVPGNAIDAAALAAVNQMPYMNRPRNFGEGFAQGLVGGLAQSRSSQAVGRSNANQSALEHYQSQLDERRKAAATLAIARHGDVPADADVAKFYNIPEGRKIPLTAVEAARRQLQEKPTAESAAYVDITDDPAAQALVAQRGGHLTKNKQGHYLVPNSWVGPPTAAEQQRQTPMSRESLRFMAEQSASGQPIDYGILRSMSPDEKRQYMQDWQELSGSGYNAARARANYKGLTGTSAALQKQLGAAEAWGNLIDANINMIEPILKQIKETGMQWTNGPARALAKQLGDVPQAQFESALLPLRNEVGKLVSTPGMTGVLTVSAQDDMKAVAGGNFTIPQLEGVFAIMKKERDNRLNAYQSAINAQLGQIGAPGETPATPTAAPPNTTQAKSGISNGVDWLKKNLGGKK